MGISWGADNAPGGGDDVIYSNGEAATTLINQLLYVGVGNAWWPGSVAEIDDTMAYIFSNGGAGGVFSVTTQYCIGTDCGSATAYATPEPASMLLMGGGLILLASRVRRLRRAA